MADGTVRPIEDVAAGDRVAACDPVTGEALARTVTATASHDDVPVLRVRTDDGGAVETTATHPFWVEDRGWTPAGRLRAGDRLLTPDGRTVEVTAAAPPAAPDGCTVSRSTASRPTTCAPAPPSSPSITNAPNSHADSNNAHNNSTTPEAVGPRRWVPQP